MRSSPHDTIGNAAPVRTKALSFCCASTVFLSKTVPFRAVPLDQVQLRGTGRIVVPHTRNNSDVWVTHSDTDGQSWAVATRLAGVVLPGWNWVGTGPPGAIQLQPTAANPAGRLVVPCYHSPDRAKNNICHGHTMLSDDGGASFYLGATQYGAADKHSNECQVAALANGSVLVRTKALSFCCASTVFLSKTVPFRAVPLDQVNARSLANLGEHQQRIQALSTDAVRAAACISSLLADDPPPTATCRAARIQQLPALLYSR